MNIAAGLILTGFLGLLISWIPFVIAAALAHKRSDRFPGLVEQTAKGPDPPRVDVSAELGPIEALIQAGRDEDALQPLWESFERHKSLDAPVEVQAPIAAMLISTLERLDKPEHASLIADHMARQKKKAAIAHSDSLFIMALQDDPNLTPRTVHTIRALQGNHRPFASAFLGRFYVRCLILGVIFNVLSAILILGSGSRIAPEGIFIFTFASWIVPWALAMGYQLYVIRTSGYEFKDGTIVFHHGGLSQKDPIYELYRLHDITPKRSFINRFSGDCVLELQFEKEAHPIRFCGWVKVNEMDSLATALREVSRALRTSSAIKGILT